MHEQTLLNAKDQDRDFHIDPVDTSAMDPGPLESGLMEAEGGRPVVEPARVQSNQ